MNDKLLRAEYQPSIYDQLSLNQLYAAHNCGHILASLVLWNRGLLNVSTIRYRHPGMNYLIIRNAYQLVKERKY